MKILSKSMVCWRLLLFFLAAGKVHAYVLDFSTFDVIDTTAIISPSDTSSVTIEEDFILSPVGVLEYDLYIPIDAASLTFNYTLDVAFDNEDYFVFYFDELSFPTDSFGAGERSWL